MTDQSVILMRSPSVKPRAGLPPTKRTAILDAARRLLVSKGYSDVVLDDVAKEAEVAKGTLYLYFKNKEELFVAAFEELVVRLGDRLLELDASGLAGEELLLEIVRSVLAHFEENKDFIFLAPSAGLPGCGLRSGDRCREGFARNIGLMQKLLPRCGAAGPDLEFRAAALFALCRAALLRKAVTQSDRPLLKDAGLVAEQFLHGASGGRR